MPTATSPTASDRPPFYGAWQPRVGLSYDLTGSGRHVLFGGYGRYYDRIIYNAGLDERFRLQYAVRTFPFSLDGAPRNGQPTIVWNPAYQSKAGLDGLIAAGIAPDAGGVPDRQRHQAAGRRISSTPACARASAASCSAPTTPASARATA